MKHLINRLLLVSAPLAVLALAGPASAQVTRSWVSGVGDDANPCSRTAPCKTFAGAISKTAAGGEISVLDPGSFGAVTITKSMSINGEWAGVAGVLASGVTGITVNAGTTGVVNLRGLALEGAGLTVSAPGTNGVNIISAAEVHLQDMVIRGFRAAGSGFGVNVANNTGDTKVTISNSLIAENGTAAGGAGVLVRPQGTFKAFVAITGSSLTGNTVGVKADGAGGTGDIKVQLLNSASNGNISQGAFAQSASGGHIQMLVDSSTLSNNASIGGRVDGANATLTVGRSTVTGNGSLGLQTLNSGVLNSYRNNQSVLNGAADSPTVQVFPE